MSLSDPDLNMVIAGRIKAALQAAGISRRMLAEHLGVSMSCVAMWVNGERTLSGPRLIQIARFVGVQPGSFLPDMREAA